MADYDIDLHPSWSIGYGSRPDMFELAPDGWYYGFNADGQYVKSQTPESNNWIIVS